MRGYENDRQCFYCGATVGYLEKDHFPIPARNGGSVTIDCCDVCHKMKDTIDVGNWPADWIGLILADFPYLRRETRLFLAKMISLSTTKVHGDS